jgi:predicted O-methyltransferase YrrM
VTALRSQVGNRVAKAQAGWHRARRWRERSGVCPPVGTGAHFALRRLLRRVARLDVHLTPPPGFTRITKSTLQFEIDDDFNRAVDDALARTGEDVPPRESDGYVRQRQRLYSLLAALRLTEGVPGLIAECGSYRGLSAYVLCRALGSDGAGLHLFDSFEGLSAPASEDQIRDDRVPKGKMKRQAGMFSASVEDLRRALAEFPAVELHKGWIPDALAGAPDGPYRFVHLDMDLHDPTAGALEFFYPRLASGGVVLCDDYGAVRWPGVRMAVDAFCAAHGVRCLPLPSGPAILFA